MNFKERVMHRIRESVKRHIWYAPAMSDDEVLQHISPTTVYKAQAEELGDALDRIEKLVTPRPVEPSAPPGAQT